MLKILSDIRDNKEIKEIREVWKSKTDKEFPIFNFDKYTGIEHYIKCIKEELSTL